MFDTYLHSLSLQTQNMECMVETSLHKHILTQTLYLIKFTDIDAVVPYWESSGPSLFLSLVIICIIKNYTCELKYTYKINICLHQYIFITPQVHLYTTFYLPGGASSGENQAKGIRIMGTSIVFRINLKVDQKSLQLESY